MVLIARTLDSYDYDECIAIQHVFNKRDGGMTAIKYGILLVTKQFISYSLIRQFSYP